ncbi:MAG: 50S ribosomal protein L31 [Gammaproteobacteria bacterium]|nr:50S ribosomal protein L31 [Gammaproteobacteria bacterium]
MSTHPDYETIKVVCSCGHTFETRSTLCKDLSIEVCSNCHPFYTGQQRVTDTGGRVQRFRDRYNIKKAPSADAAGSADAK